MGGKLGGTVMRRWRARLLFGVLILSLGSSCVSAGDSGQFAFLTSRRLVDDRIQIQRLAVFANITGDPFTEPMFQRFQAGIANTLARCDVRSIAVPDPMPVGPYLGEAVQSFGPTHALYINRRKDRGVATVDELGQKIHVVNRTYFQLTLIALETSATLWMAEAEMWVESGSSDDFGVKLSDILAARLRNDRVLHGCR